ncbi:MAG TPA: BTAD domain-containing putative transcriptional regulator [Acidimicrobiales bacterium]|nr:BTAD domain-containing putative transcriptional regulator [Acidimicrobiales bacterium]
MQVDEGDGGERMTDGGFSSGFDPVDESDYLAEEPPEPRPDAIAAQESAAEASNFGQPDPAALVVAWLRRGFDGLHVEVQQLASAIEQQQADLIRMSEAQSALTRIAESQALLGQAVESQSSEINVSLAELEGCAAQLRNEASNLQRLRDELSVGIGAVLLELREALTAELAGIVAQAVEPVVGAAVVDLSARIDEAQTRIEQLDDPMVALRMVTDELNQRVPAIVREAVRSALATSGAPQGPVPIPQPEPFFEPSAPEVQPPEAALGAAVGELPPNDPGVALRVAAPEAPPVSSAAEDAGFFVAAGADESPAATAVPGATDQEWPAEPQVELAIEEPVAISAEPVAAPVEPVAEPLAERPAEPLVDSPAEPLVDAIRVGVGVVEDELGGTEVTCVMPGVAVGPSLALAVTASLERSRIRRRRRRRAGPPGAGLHRRDPYVGDVGQRLERFALARGDRAFEARDADALPELRVAAGEYGGHEFAIDLGVLGCLCLVGTQAADVARALAASLLAQPARAQSEVLSIGDLFPDGPTVPGLTRTESARAALDRLEAEIADRAERLADDGAESVAVYNARHPDAPVTPLLISAVRLAEDESQRLEALVSEGGHCGIAAVIVDAQLDGSPTLRLKRGGVVERLHPETTLGGLIGARLFLLSSDSIAQILEVLAAARTDSDDVTVADDEPFVVVDPPGEVPIQVQLLGPYRIDAAGKEIRSGLRAKARELLAFYLLHPEGTTLDTATEALWPEADPGRGSEWFWTALGNLRSLLRSTTGIKELKVIEREGDIYKVEPIFDVDLWRLQQVLDEASTNGNRAGNDVGGDELWAECLQRAAELYTSELLEGADWAWARVPRDDLRRRAVDVLVSLSATRLVTGDIRGALDVLEKAIDVDPYAEQLYRRIIRLHSKLSRPDAVTATFRRLKTRLAEIDLEPTAESENLSRELSVAGA